MRPLPELVVDAHAILGQGPHWDSRRQRLLWVDIEGHDLHVSDPVSGADERLHLAEHVGCAVSAGTTCSCSGPAERVRQQG